MKNSLIWTLLIIVVILFIPLIAMQFTEEVNWKPFDFLIAALLLTFIGILINIAIKKISNFNYRILIILGLLIALVLIWIEIAVGVFNTPLAGN